MINLVKNIGLYLKKILGLGTGWAMIIAGLISSCVVAVPVIIINLYFHTIKYAFQELTAYLIDKIPGEQQAVIEVTGLAAWVLSQLMIPEILVISMSALIIRMFFELWKALPLT